MKGVVDLVLACDGTAPDCGYCADHHGCGPMSDRLLDLFNQLIEAEMEKDSLEVEPAGSRIKIYGSFDDEAAFVQKIDRALRLRAHALEKLAEQGGT